MLLSRTHVVISIYVATTAHGFGHATRSGAVIHHLLKLNPEILPIFVTTSPPWLLDKYVQGRYLHRPRHLDVGVVQQDGLQMDLNATLKALETLKQKSAQIIAAEADYIRTNQVKLVFGDIPPLAVAIAEAAGVPCWMEGNFGWDFIYQPYGPDFEPIVAWITDLYQRCDKLFQLPMHEPMSAFPHRELVGLTGGDPQKSADELRVELELDPEQPVALLTFGGYGISDFPYHNLNDFSDWLFITFDANAPEFPNLLRLNGQAWRPVDVMPVCTCIISKPGYGTISEALRTQTPMICITREGFAEADLLLEGLKRYGWNQIVSQVDFLEKPWIFLDQPFEKPLEPDTIDSCGNQTIAQSIDQFLRSDS